MIPMVKRAPMSLGVRSAIAFHLSSLDLLQGSFGPVVNSLEIAEGLELSLTDVATPKVVVVVRELEDAEARRVLRYH
jgi:hypothetical protein